MALLFVMRMVTEKRKLGDYGETLAWQYLQKKGYTILQKNFRVPHGEIDIIAEKDGKTFFVEVKTRTSERYGTPLEGVGSQKINRMYRAIETYFRSKGRDPDEECFQIDIISIDLPPHAPPKLQHIENAVEDGDF